MMSTVETRDVATIRAGEPHLDVDVVLTLLDLTHDRVLTKTQARRLFVEWFTLDDGAWSQPWLRGVREHTRMYIGPLGTSSALL